MIGVYFDGVALRVRHDLAVPEPRPHEQILAVRCAGICDTDLQLAQGYLGFRGILGHEFVGQTQDGRRVTAEINNACGNCPSCQAGLSNHCPNRTVLGIVSHDGAMAEHVSVPTSNLHEIPDTLDDLEAVFIEPLAAALRITEQVAIPKGHRAAVLGDGKLGLLCAWVLREAGAQVVWIGKHPGKLALAGADIETRTLSEIDGLAGQVDLVVDATGSPSGLQSAIGLLRPCGTLVLKTTVARPYEIDLAPVVINEIRLIGSRCGPFPKAIAALVSGRYDVRRLIGATFRLADAEDAFRAAATPGARKIVLTM